THGAMDSGSDACFEQIKAWINDCVEQHSICKQPEFTALPSRVIDVGPLDGSQEPKLVETKGLFGKYLTLSHCWGGSQPIKTVRDTLEENKRCILWSSIPKTFQDAITITRRLELQYLWIDSLCIIQDDTTDWELESANMAAIYENSLLTISASLAANANQGCFSLRDPPYEVHGLGPNGQQYSVLVRKLMSHDDLSVNAARWAYESGIPLLDRAWAYQERLLATRIVHFLPRELFWECKDALRCECAEYIPPSSTNSRDFIQLALKIWPMIVSEYSARSLTFRKDRLPALSGVAKRMEEKTNSAKYMAGIWSNHLPTALLWQIKYHHSTPEPPGRRDWHPDGQAPSWSWASIEGEGIYIKYRVGDLEESSVQILDVNIVPAGIDPTGAIKLGRITLRGMVATAALHYYTSSKTGRGSATIYQLRKNDLVCHIYPDTPLSDGEDFLPHGYLLSCLRFGTVHKIDTRALILRQSRYFPDLYERVGEMCFQDHDQAHIQAKSWFRNAKEIEITIV
ncbi:HET-domain-containing protein, partial [Glonium stellatum]